MKQRQTRLPCPALFPTPASAATPVCLPGCIYISALLFCKWMNFSKSLHLWQPWHYTSVNSNSSALSWECTKTQCLTTVKPLSPREHRWHAPLFKHCVAINLNPPTHSEAHFSPCHKQPVLERLRKKWWQPKDMPVPHNQGLAYKQGAHHGLHSTQRGTCIGSTLLKDIWKPPLKWPNSEKYLNFYFCSGARGFKWRSCHSLCMRCKYEIRECLGILMRLNLSFQQAASPISFPHVYSPTLTLVYPLTQTRVHWEPFGTVREGALSWTTIKQPVPH